jgi:hypothetical protein
MCVSFQEDDIVFDNTLTDQYPFQAMTLDVRYHKQLFDQLWQLENR